MNLKTDVKKKPVTAAKKNSGLSAEEIAAMKETIKERKMAANKEEMEKAVFEKIAAMKDNERVMAKKIHGIVKAVAPQLTPKTWYGMPAYANAEGKVICFFQAASKFGVRYSTLGFNPDAKLDDGNMWAAGFAVVKITAIEETKIAALVKKAVRQETIF
ncbi:MAG: DUF1801 domain-containing protein [Anaerolineales bacterium]|nr:DUF1801 domain-containing protein [Anaerolineales bacterium]MCL4259773.1 DUF1801 domain-containing protein [Anaerolineales bacterium]